MPGKVLIIDNSTYPTGALKSIVLATDEIDDFEFYFAVSKKVKGYIKGKFLPITYLELQKGLSIFLYLPFLIYNTVKLARFCNKYSIAIVHVNDFYNIAGVLLKLIKPELKLIYHIRLLPSSYQKSLYSLRIKFINKYADHIIAVSGAVRKELLKIDEVPNLSVIYDFVNLPQHYPEKDYSKHLITNFIYLGNFIPGKGQYIALEAFKDIISKHQNVQLQLIGGTTTFKSRKYKEKLIKYINDNQLNEFVMIKDFTENIEWEIKNADISLNFSESESFSMTCYESLYYGTPVIATRSGGPQELVVDQKSGSLVEVANLKEIISSFNLVLEDKSLIEKWGRFGYQDIRNKINKNNTSALIKTIYEN